MIKKGQVFLLFWTRVARKQQKLLAFERSMAAKPYFLQLFRAHRKNRTPKQYKLLAFRDPKSRPSQNHYVLYHFSYQKSTSKKFKKLNAETIVKHSVSATVLRKQYFLLSFRARKKKVARKQQKLLAFERPRAGNDTFYSYFGRVGKIVTPKQYKLLSFRRPCSGNDTFYCYFGRAQRWGAPKQYKLLAFERRCCLNSSFYCRFGRDFSETV